MSVSGLFISVKAGSSGLGVLSPPAALCSFFVFCGEQGYPKQDSADRRRRGIGSKEVGGVAVVPLLVRRLLRINSCV